MTKGWKKLRNETKANDKECKRAYFIFQGDIEKAKSYLISKWGNIDEK